MSPSAEEFARVYDSHVGDVYAFLRYRVPSQDEAEDLTQQTFERGLRAWNQFDPRRAKPKTWLLAIARNLLIDHYRRGAGGRAGPLDEVEVDDLTTGVAESTGARLGLSPEVESALASLSERERELVALRYGGDLGGQEIAQLLGLSIANVHQILSRAMRKLRDELSAPAE